MVTGEPRAGKVHVCWFLNFPCTVCNVAFCAFIYFIFFYLGVSKLGGTCIAGFYWRFGKGMDFEESSDHLQLWPISSQSITTTLPILCIHRCTESGTTCSKKSMEDHQWFRWGRFRIHLPGDDPPWGRRWWLPWNCWLLWQWRQTCPLQDQTSACKAAMEDICWYTAVCYFYCILHILMYY